MPRDIPSSDGRGVSRRGLLSGAAVAATVAVTGPLAGCGRERTAKEGTTGADEVSKALPAYVPNESIKPDQPAVQGANGAMSDPLFLKYPDNPVTTVTGTPGKGGSYGAMTPLWGSIPATSGNAYYEAVNAALGATMKMSPLDGNSYGEKLAPLIAAKKLPDWLQIPGWENRRLSLGNGIGQFADLTPYLAGDKVKDYPNLANLPTSAWQPCVWDGKLYGLPAYPSGAGVNGAYFYRADLFAKLGINADDIKTPDDLINLGKEVTNARAGVWAFDDMFGDDAAYICQPFKFPGVTNWGPDASGKLIHKYETEAIKEALNWHAKLVKAGYVHPDAVAGRKESGVQRFHSGKVHCSVDGTGAWNGQDARSGTAANPSYRRAAFKLFSVDGKPEIEIRPGAGMFSYLNAKLSPDQVKECLAIANYLAAPYGSKEWLIVNFGTAGTTYTMKDGNPVLTEKGSKEVATTYQFLVSPVTPTTVQEGFAEVAKAYATWQADMVKYAVKPLFFGMNITEPPQYSSIGQPVTDVITDVRFGRKPISAFEDAVKTWRSAGGDALRTFYQGIKDKYGTGQ